jgi:hypothetical protein
VPGKSEEKSFGCVDDVYALQGEKGGRRTVNDVVDTCRPAKISLHFHPARLNHLVGKVVEYILPQVYQLLTQQEGVEN